MKPGITLVISPLLSLIQDQIVTLNLKFGIPATFLNSQQTASQAAAVLHELRQVIFLAGKFFFFFSEFIDTVITEKVFGLAFPFPIYVFFLCL